MTPPPIPATAPISDDSEDDLAQEIYCRLAVPLAQDVQGYEDPHTSEEFHRKLRRAALIAKVTAKVYFEECSTNG